MKYRLQNNEQHAARVLLMFIKKQEGGKNHPLAFYNRQSKQHVKDKNYKIERGQL